MSQNEESKSSFSHKAPMSATDLRCYFQCVEVFKKDYDLRIHLKIRHRGDDKKESEKAYKAAEEDIAQVKRSACSHLKTCHKIKWEEYIGYVRDMMKDEQRESSSISMLSTVARYIKMLT